MIHLDDLIPQEHDYSFDAHCDSDGKLTYLPELKQIKEVEHTHPSLDHFLTHLQDHHNHHPCSLIYSNDHTDQELQADEGLGLNNQKKRKGKAINKSRNQTKNIPKNFGKGIISFIIKNKQSLRPIIESYCLNFQQFISHLQEKKMTINTIAQLRSMWTGEMGACMRVISNQFFRKYALQYIFNSRISSYESHIKYRSSLWSALKQPQSFNHIKQY